jgi:hypothetical protein
MSYYGKYKNVSDLLGKTLTSVIADSDEITFVTSEGTTYKMYHAQDCCEHVYIDSIVGDLQDLVGHPILLAEEVTSEDYQAGQEKSDWDGSFTWTFYKFATIKGYVDIRWFGSSNGYYSESVDFVEV